MKILLIMLVIRLIIRFIYTDTNDVVGSSSGITTKFDPASFPLREDLEFRF